MELLSSYTYEKDPRIYIVLTERNLQVRDIIGHTILLVATKSLKGGV